MPPEMQQVLAGNTCLHARGSHHKKALASTQDQSLLESLLILTQNRGQRARRIAGTATPRQEFGHGQLMRHPTICKSFGGCRSCTLFGAPAHGLGLSMILGDMSLHAGQAEM
eukprot:4467435-Amphidinium_carterae.1